MRNALIAVLSVLLPACGDTEPAGDHAHDEVGAHDHDHDHDLEHDHVDTGAGDWASTDHEHESDQARYTDEEAVAAVQNDDPWSDPDRANLANLWHSHERGWMWLDQARLSLDNRTIPPGVGERHELIQLFHESLECDDTMAFDDCNSTSALKIYANGPRIDTNNWSEAGFAEAAVRQQHTHSSGIYLVSFGRNFVPTDYGYGIIPGSGLHLEPHGAHQAIRVDGTGNAGENVRIDVMAGATGMSIYGSETAALYCEELGQDCTETRLATLRGGIVRLEDATFERSAVDARDAGVVTVHDTSLGVEHFYSWHSDDQTDLPVHCTWNDTVTDDSLVKLTPYSTSPDLLVAHSYALVEVWGPGNAPTACTDAQSIKTDAYGVYGYDFGATIEAGAGFSVAILGPDEDPLYPGDWQETERPSFLYEVIEPL